LKNAIRFDEDARLSPRKVPHKRALAAWWLSARNRMKELMLRLSKVPRAGAIEPFATPEQLHWGCEIF
jgi:hypothetical protein